MASGLERREGESDSDLDDTNTSPTSYELLKEDSDSELAERSDLARYYAQKNMDNKSEDNTSKEDSDSTKDGEDSDSSEDDEDSDSDLEKYVNAPEIALRNRYIPMKHAPSEPKFNIIYDLIKSEITGKSNRKTLKNSRKLHEIICHAHVRKEFRNVKPKKSLFSLQKKYLFRLSDGTYSCRIKNLHHDVLDDIFSDYGKICLHGLLRYLVEPSSKNLRPITFPAHNIISKYVSALVKIELKRFKVRRFSLLMLRELGDVSNLSSGLKEARRRYMQVVEDDDYVANNGEDENSLQADHLD